jgi:hypothetical protein
MNRTTRVLTALTFAIGLSVSCSGGSSGTGVGTGGAVSGASGGTAGRAVGGGAGGVVGGGAGGAVGGAVGKDAGPADVSTSLSNGGSSAGSGGASGSGGAGGAACPLASGKICPSGSICEIGKCSDGTKISCSCNDGVAQCTPCSATDAGPPPNSGPPDGAVKMNVGSAMETSALPECPATLSGLLTASMVDPSNLAGLIPLGNSNPPQHTVPVDHVYFTSPYSFNGSCTNGHVCMPTIPFYAPGDGTVVTVLEVATTYLDGSPDSTSYEIDFALCRGLLLRMAGITGLEPSLLTLVHQATPSCKSIAPKHTNEASTEFCYYMTSIIQKGGTQIGSTGGLEFPEVWAFNYNLAPDPAIDWSRYDYEDYAYAVCLFDLYDGELNNTLFSKFGRVTTAVDGGAAFVPRTAAPICGTARQTIVGTAQGDWFATAAGGWDNPNFGFGTADLSLIHDNYDPTLGKFSIGGQILVGVPGNLGVAMFTPQHSGTINREFSEILPGATIYCYQSDGGPPWGQSGKLLVSLTDAHHLRIENQTGSCGSSESFQSSFDYER